MNKQNSGIEHAQIQRAKVFDEYNKPYMIVNMGYNRQQSLWLDRFGIKSDKILTLFDYYQGTQVIESKRVLPEDIFMSDLDVRYELSDDKPMYLVYENGGNQGFVGRIHWFNDLPYKQVSFVERFDVYGNLYRVDEYDVRGFLTRSQLYTPDNKVYAYIWFDLSGRPVITQQVALNADGEYYTGMYEVVDKHGYRNYYGSFRDVVIKFLNDLNDEYFDINMPNFFVGDRLEGYEDAILHLKRPAIKISHIHNSHASDVHNVDTSILNNYYLFDFYNKDQYDFYICATNKQTRDVIQRLNLDGRVFMIPVGLTEKVDKVPMHQRNPHSVLVTARRAEEKRIELIIESIGKAQKVISDINLDVYGYRDSRNNDAAKKKIDAMIEKYGLADKVHIHNYDPDLDAQRDSHQVYMVFSTMEGFNIALMEAQNHGEVAVVNDVNYGPNELVVNGKNGFVVDFSDTDSASEKLIQLFMDDTLLQSMSDSAYELSTRYSASVIAGQWQKLENKALEYWNHTVLREIDSTGLDERVDADYNGPIRKD